MTDPFVRAARAIGDLGNPFYDEERQRDVWNEASAFGLQLALWLVLLAATAVVWTVGEPSVPYALGGVGLIALVSAATALYATRLGVDVFAGARVLRLRLLPYALLLGALVAGLVRAGDLGESVGSGMAAGVAVGVVVTALAVRRSAQRG